MRYGICAAFFVSYTLIYILFDSPRLSPHDRFKEAISGVASWTFVEICFLMSGDIFGEVVTGFFIGFWVWMAWKNRPRGKGKKIAKWLGEKSRAAIKKLTDTAGKVKPKQGPGRRIPLPQPV